MKVQERLRCMLVDDDRDVLAVMSEVIQVIGGAEVVSFSNPMDAILALRKDPFAFDLVISDYDMPQLDGIEMCHVMRGVSPDLRTILATGNTQITEAEAAAEGFDLLLRKPFTIPALQAALGAIRRRRHTSTPSWYQHAA